MSKLKMNFSHENWFLEIKVLSILMKIEHLDFDTFSYNDTTMIGIGITEFHEKLLMQLWNIMDLP